MGRRLPVDAYYRGLECYDSVDASSGLEVSPLHNMPFKLQVYSVVGQKYVAKGKCLVSPFPFCL